MLILGQNPCAKQLLWTSPNPSASWTRTQANAAIKSKAYRELVARDNPEDKCAPEFAQRPCFSASPPPTARFPLASAQRDEYRSYHIAAASSTTHPHLARIPTSRPQEGAAISPQPNAVLTFNKPSPPRKLEAYPNLSTITEQPYPLRLTKRIRNSLPQLSRL